VQPADGGEFSMTNWTRIACLTLGTMLAFASGAETDESKGAPEAGAVRAGTVVDINPSRIYLIDVTHAGDRLVAVGERGFAMVSDDSGKSWKAVGTPVVRTLTGVAFDGEKVGVAVGHGGSIVRTEDGGDTWTEVPMEEAYGESFLGVTATGDGKFAVYGAFGMYFDSMDGGRTWTRRTVISEDFERHISEVIVGNHGLLGMVGESGTLARSLDGGETWEEYPSAYPGSYFGAVQTDDDALVAFGMRGSVYRSTDLGLSWQRIEVGTTASFNGGLVLSDGRIVLVGNAGLVATSSDKGQSFKIEWSPAGKGFSALAETPAGLVVVGGAGVGMLDLSTLVTK